MRLLWLLVGLMVATALLVCVMCASGGLPPEQLSPSKQKVQIVLLCSTPRVKAGNDIVLWLAVHNNDPKPVSIDGRMIWPGNIFLWVRVPGSSEETGGETIRPGISRPKKDDLVSVQPGCFYGSKLVVGPHSDAPLIRALKTLRRGRYTFSAVYHSPRAPDLGVDGFEMQSKEVSVVVY